MKIEDVIKITERLVAGESVILGDKIWDTIHKITLQALREKAERETGCAFCCYTEYPSKELYKREKSEFYFGRSKQLEIDVFDEDETDECNFCANCGRKLVPNEI